jgi:hypothetical protein
MEPALSWQRRVALFRGYQTLYSQYPSQLTIDLTFLDQDQGFTFDRAFRRIEVFLRRIERAEDMSRGAFVSIGRRRGRLHAHILALGRGRGSDRTLLDFNYGYWERQWPARAEIEPVRSHVRAAKYVAGQMTKNESCENFVYDPTDILRRSRIEPDQGIPVGSLEDMRRHAMDEDQ